MNSANMIVLFRGCINMLKTADNLKLDVTRLVADKVLRELNGLNETFEIEYNGFYRTVPTMTANEIDVARYKGKIDSIKNYKERTKCSLMDSKLAVEQYMQAKGYAFFRY